VKIFIDTANLAQIEEVDSWGILDGVTTNPTLIAKENTEPKALVRKICEAVGGPVSMEAMSTKAADIVKEGKELAKIHPNIVVKVPMTEEGLKATKALSKDCVKVNMTLVFSSNQALLAAKAGAAYVSPFVGRLDDIGEDGMNLVSEILDIYDNYDFDTEVIVASVRQSYPCRAGGAHGRGHSHHPVRRSEEDVQAPAHGHRHRAVPERLGICAEALKPGSAIVQAEDDAAGRLPRSPF